MTAPLHRRHLPLALLAALPGTLLSSLPQPLDHRPLPKRLPATPPAWLSSLRAVLWAIMLAAAPAQAGGLLAASDLRAEAQTAAQQQRVLVLLYTRADCPHCETVRRQYLAPLVARQDPRLTVREIRIDETTPLTDFHGRASHHADFARQEKVRLVPVVAFYGPQGQSLGAPLIGTLIADFYASYLDTRLNEALARLPKRP